MFQIVPDCCVVVQIINGYLQLVSKNIHAKTRVID